MYYTISHLKNLRYNSSETGDILETPEKKFLKNDIFITNFKGNIISEISQKVKT